jgi:hypothetical protein
VYVQATELEAAEGELNQIMHVTGKACLLHIEIPGKPRRAGQAGVQQHQSLLTMSTYYPTVLLVHMHY